MLQLDLFSAFRKQKKGQPLSTLTQAKLLEPPPARQAAALPTPVDSGAFESDEALLGDKLKRHAGGHVRVVLTQNKHTLISTQQKGELLVFRLHRMFLLADDQVLAAVAWLPHARLTREARLRINAFIHAHSHLVRPEAKRASQSSPHGLHHDLEGLLAGLNARYFENGVGASIRWGSWSRRMRRRKRSIQLGSFSASAQQITIHPALDQTWVPGFFVEAVVYHEMLHARYPSQWKGSHACHHSPEFRKAERMFHHHQKAIAWQEAHLSRLLRSRPPWPKP